MITQQLSTFNVALSAVTFVQTPTQAFPNRKKTISFNFVTQFDAEDSWNSFTNKATITFPKNIIAYDELGNIIHLANQNVNIGGFSGTDPLFLRGDKATIKAGYKYFDKAGNVINNVSTIFEGYISKITSKKPIVLELEDKFWLLKQVPAPAISFPASQYSLEGMVAYLINIVNQQKGTSFTVNRSTTTSIGNYRTGNETVADVLSRLRKDYHFESIFYNNELRVGLLVYLPGVDVTHTFIFQKTIIDDSLEYQRKEDIVLSAVAHSETIVAAGGTTRDGKLKSKVQRTEVLVTLQNGVFTTQIRNPGDKNDFPPANQGERRTLFFNNVSDPQALSKLAQAELVKYYFTGMKGSFTTFMTPFVRQGDNALIIDNTLPERNGTYRIKSVKYSGGINGMRQQIELDFKL